VIAGRYITTLLERQQLPQQYDLALLQSLCQQYGYTTKCSNERLAAIWQTTYGLHAKQTAGSAHPNAVKVLLQQQTQDLEQLREEWLRRIKHVGAMALQVEHYLNKNEG
jgi:argininosuccinate lyase